MGTGDPPQALGVQPAGRGAGAAAWNSCWNAFLVCELGLELVPDVAPCRYVLGVIVFPTACRVGDLEGRGLDQGRRCG